MITLTKTVTDHIIEIMVKRDSVTVAVIIIVSIPQFTRDH